VAHGRNLTQGLIVASDPSDRNSTTSQVEAAPHGVRPEVSERVLALRIRQQEILAQLGVIALQRTPLQELLDRTAELAAEGLQAELCKVLEYDLEARRLVMRAGIGWDPGLVGVASLGVDLESPAGYALQTGEPVISNQLEHEERFRTPELLRTHGVRRAINVILQGDGSPYGVLEVDSRSTDEFNAQDISFLQGAANILGMAIERERYERSLRAALEHQKILIGEINHRVKNSLQLVASMFSLQAKATSDPALAQSLQEAMGRITAVARVHERLYRSPDILTVDLGGYIGEICVDLSAVSSKCDIAFACDGQIFLPTDRAVRVALLVSELVTNSAKHAIPQHGVARVRVSLARRGDDHVVLSVRDDGPGLSPQFDIEKSKSLGMRIIHALVSQSGGTLSIRRQQPGAEFVIELPLAADAST
jgi:two-component sensor histidine kinase